MTFNLRLRSAHGHTAIIICRNCAFGLPGNRAGRITYILRFACGILALVRTVRMVGCYCMRVYNHIAVHIDKGIDTFWGFCVFFFVARALLFVHITYKCLRVIGHERETYKKKREKV